MGKRRRGSRFIRLRIICSDFGRFIPENHSIIARGAADLTYRRIEPHLSDYMGKVFEEICKQFLWNLLLSGQSPVAFQELGRWWGTDPATRSQTEIDIMGGAG